MATTLWLRWQDSDNIGADALLAVDESALSTGSTPLSNRSSALQAALGLYPNLVTDVLHLSVNGRRLPAAGLEITDLAGRTLLRGQTSVDGTFSLRGLAAGTYLATGSIGTERFPHKVVKQ